MTEEARETVYDLAEAYDIAFDFRDLPRECRVLRALYERHAGRPPESFLELACGPGYHCHRFAEEGLASYGLDRNEHMLAYARAKALRLGVAVDCVGADLRDFRLPRPVDLAFTPMASIHCLLTNDDLARHLSCLAENLAPGGIYVIEGEHPRDLFRESECSTIGNEWESERDGTKVRTHWGSESRFDSLTQVSRMQVRMEVEREGRVETFLTQDESRHLTYQELLLLIDACEGLEAVQWLGALDEGQPFDESAAAIRMIPVLRKV